MRIYYYHQYFVPPNGSGGTRSYEMARRLVAAGHDVTIITSSAFFPSTYNFSKIINDTIVDGIRLKVIKVPYSNKLCYYKRLLAFILFALLAVREALRIHDASVVFATSTPLTIAFPGIVAKRASRCPMVFEVRDLWPELPIAVGALKNPLLKLIAKYFERWVYHNSDNLIALSPGMKEGVVRCGYPSAKVSVIPNSCDVELFRVPKDRGDQFVSRHPFLSGTKIVSYTGTLGIINGVEYLIDIAAAMQQLDTNVSFLITGDGMMREHIIERACTLGVYKKNLWIISPVPKSEVPDLLSASSVACSLFINLPEMWHNSANKFFDALAAGCPVMINYAGWQKEVLLSSGAGLVVPPDNPQEAANMLCAFINDQERLMIARAAARSLADNDFNRDELFDKLHRVLAQTATVAPARVSCK